MLKNGVSMKVKKNGVNGDQKEETKDNEETRVMEMKIKIRFK